MNEDLAPICSDIEDETDITEMVKNLKKKNKHLNIKVFELT